MCNFFKLACWKPHKEDDVWHESSQMELACCIDSTHARLYTLKTLAAITNESRHNTHWSVCVLSKLYYVLPTLHPCHLWQIIQVNLKNKPLKRTNNITNRRLKQGEHRYARAYASRGHRWRRCVVPAKHYLLVRLGIVRVILYLSKGHKSYIRDFSKVATEWLQSGFSFPYIS